MRNSIRRTSLAPRMAAAVGIVALGASLAACTPSTEGTQDTDAAANTSSVGGSSGTADVTAPSSDSAEGGSSAPASSPTGPPPSASALATDPNTGAKVESDAEGRVKRNLGQAGTLTEPKSDKAAFTIAVSQPRELSSCIMRGFGDKLTPEHGRFVEVKISATLSKAAAEEQVGLTAQSFVPLDAKGKPLAESAWSQSAEGCEIKNPLDLVVLAGETSRGELMLDVPKGTAAVAFDPEGSKGWSWPLRK